MELEGGNGGNGGGDGLNGIGGGGGCNGLNGFGGCGDSGCAVGPVGGCSVGGGLCGETCGGGIACGGGHHAGATSPFELVGADLLRFMRIMMVSTAKFGIDRTTSMPIPLRILQEQVCQRPQSCP